MRKKIFLLLAALLVLSMAGPAARAGSGGPLSPGRSNSQASIQSDDIPLLELPTAEISMEVLADSGGEAAVQVSAEQMMEAVESVASGDAVSITIAANGADGASSVSAAIPRKALAAAAERTNAEISVVSEIGQVTLSHTAIASIVEQAEDEDITVAMTRTAEETNVKIDILSGGRSIPDWAGMDTAQSMVVSPLAAQRGAAPDSGGASVRRYAAGLCIAAAVLTLAGGITAGVVMKRRQAS